MPKILHYIHVTCGGLTAALLITLLGMLPLTIPMGYMIAWFRGPTDIQGPAGIGFSAPLGIVVGAWYAGWKLSVEPNRRRAASYIAWGTAATLLVSNFAILAWFVVFD